MEEIFSVMIVVLVVLALCFYYFKGDGFMKDILFSVATFILNKWVTEPPISQILRFHPSATNAATWAAFCLLLFIPSSAHG